MSLPEVVIAPLPAVITPPVGNSVGDSAAAGRQRATSAAMLNAPLRMIGQPAAPAISETTIHFSRIADQIILCILFMNGWFAVDFQIPFRI
jgi:hypothetical protein